jgi:hypothetical protein
MTGDDKTPTIKDLPEWPVPVAAGDVLPGASSWLASNPHRDKVTECANGHRTTTPTLGGEPFLLVRILPAADGEVGSDGERIEARLTIVAGGGVGHGEGFVITGELMMAYVLDALVDLSGRGYLLGNDYGGVTVPLGSAAGPSTEAPYGVPESDAPRQTPPNGAPVGDDGAAGDPQGSPDSADPAGGEAPDSDDR